MSRQYNGDSGVYIVLLLKKKKNHFFTYIAGNENEKF
jgi:hypothetical protein